MKELCAQPFVVRETGSMTKSLVERALAERGLRVEPVMALGSTEAIKQAVASGMGVAVVSGLAVRADVKARRVVELMVNVLSLRRPLYQLKLRGRQVGEAGEAFSEWLRMRRWRSDEVGVIVRNFQLNHASEAIRGVMMEKTTLTLPVISVREPCSADWDGMSVVEGGRFCSHCQRVVHDLSAMKADAVAELVCREAGRLCVRYEVADGGAVKTLDYQPRDERGRRTRRWFLAGGVLAVIAGCANLMWWRKVAPPAPAARPMFIAGAMLPIAPPATQPTNAPMLMGSMAPVRPADSVRSSHGRKK